MGFVTRYIWNVLLFRDRPARFRLVIHLQPAGMLAIGAGGMDVAVAMAATILFEYRKW